MNFGVLIRLMLAGQRVLRKPSSQTLNRRVWPGVCSLAAALCVGAPGSAVGAETFFTTNASWRIFKGRSEASSPDTTAWRHINFDDSSWSSGPAPIFYSTAPIEPPFYGGGVFNGTTLSDMQYGYSCVFLRKTFVVSNAASLPGLNLTSACDDGYIGWINGVEVARENVRLGSLAYNEFAEISRVEPMPIVTYTITNFGGLLVDGTNVLAVQAFNRSIDSSDFGFMAELRSLVDDVPPVIASVNPPAEATVRSLTQIQVIFGEAVTGVDAADLRINGVPATGLSVGAPDRYLFTFPQPATGLVMVAWAPGHGIRDPAQNAFGGGSWNYLLDTNGALATVAITEFMAANATTLLDEDGESSDWIEIFNPGTTAVSLDGWFLTDEREHLAKWRFPDKLLPASGYLVVFASDRDRRAPGAPLHTNFKLDAAGGYLALVRPDGVSIASQFTYGEQHTDVSYGSRGIVSVNYFTTPTPGAPNGPGKLGFVNDTHFVPDRGFYFAPFSVRVWVNTPGATLVYTTNGTVPTLVNGIVAPGTNVTIPITRTTLLRAAAFKAEYEPSDVDTHTYIFPAAVATQTRPGGVGPTWPGNYPADFEMDARVINNALPGYRLTNALLDIPSISIVMPPADLWDFANGMYANPLQEGVERVASIEMLFAGTQPGVQKDAGLSIRGFSSESKSLTPKHSFTIVYRREYGAPSLRFPVFPDTEVRDFNGLVLRGNVLDSWANSEIDWNHFIDGELRWYRTRASYVRDQWMRDAQLAQGHLSAHGRFVHVYLNGSYWGIYNLDERLDEQFAAQYLGGSQDDYDVIADGEIKSGDGNAWGQMLSLAGANLSIDANYQRLMGNNGDGTRNPAYPVLVDMTNLVDYMILHIYAGADDWPWHNWVAIRRRTPDSTGFEFLAWDQEISINSLVKEHTDGGIEYAEVYGAHTSVYQACRANAEFRQFFADRVQHNLFNTGPLSVSNNIARYNARVAEIDRAIVAESARWGDFFRPTQPYLREAEWLGTNQWMRQVFFPSNHFVALRRFRTANLFPSLDAPRFSQFGGAVPAGFALTITNPNAGSTLYFTTTGADPRRPGGSVAPGAQVYSAPLIINSPTLVRARVLSSTEWSALVEALFYPPQDLSRLALTEIMYNPPAVGAIDGDEFEFIELKNRDSVALNLSGLMFTSGISFTFTNGTVLAPGQFFVLVRNPGQFAARYPNVAFQGVYNGRLDNGGETVTLSHSVGTTVLSVTYDDEAPWPVTPDNFGFSLVPRNSSTSQAPDNGAKWRASASAGGSPGADDPEPNIPPIVINEILTHTDLPQVDTIELFNPTLASVNLGGWFLSDDARTPKKYCIPLNTTIPARGYWVVDENQWGTNIFGLSSHGDELYLFSGDANTNLTGYSHGFAFDAAPAGVSFGRHVNSVGDEQFPLQIAFTPGNANFGPVVGPVVISEIMYHPAPGGDEFVELKNLTSTNLPLFDPANPMNTWRLDGLGYSFPSNVVMGANSYLLVVSTDPTSFRNRYSVPMDVPILGPFAGLLQDSGERLKLQRADAPDFTPAGVVVPYVTIESVRYNDKSPWPPAADGSGHSLQRLYASLYGDDPINWQAAEPTPGRSWPDSDGDSLPDWWEMANGTAQFVPDAGADPDGDGHSNLQEYLAGTNPTLAASVFRIRSQLLDGSGNLVLQFSAPANRYYTIYATLNLASPVLWQPLVHVAPDSEGFFTVTLPSLGSGQRFFQVGTP